MKNLAAKIPNGLTIFFGVFLIITITLCAFFTRILGPNNYAYFTLNNVLFFSLAVAVVFILIFVAIIFNKKGLAIPKINKWTYRLALLILSCLVFAYYLLIINNINYVAAGDVYDVTLNSFQAPEIINNMQDHSNTFYEYFSVNQNVIFQLGLFSKIYYFLTDTKLAQGFLTVIGTEVTKENIGTTVYKVVQMIGAMGVWTSCVLVSQIVKSKINSFSGIVCLLFSFLFIAISPIAIVPYSDSYSLVFTTGIIAAYTLIKNRNIKYFLITALTIIGMQLKPTVLAVLLAVGIVEFSTFFRSKKTTQFFASHTNKTNIAPIVKFCLSMALSLCMAFGVVSYVKNVGIDFDNNKQLTWTHFLALGANTESDGVFDGNDYNRSASAETVEQREQENLDLFRQRVQDMGFIGSLRHYTNKNIQNYANGTMCPFYYYKNVQIGEENQFIRTVFGIRSNYGHDSYNSRIDSLTPYNVCTQVMWFSVLICCCFCLCRLQKNKTVQVAAISLLALSVFLIIFEASCRYLFLYKTYFVLLCFFGVAEIWKLSKKYFR